MVICPPTTTIPNPLGNADAIPHQSVAGVCPECGVTTKTRPTLRAPRLRQSLEIVTAAPAVAAWELWHEPPDEERG